MRGEYQFFSALNHIRIGSPPLARGIRGALRALFNARGITPACAGNTAQLRKDLTEAEDHPRLRGEYCTMGDGTFQYAGSPPLARGIHHGLHYMLVSQRITPACAGNTQDIIAAISTLGDHPRLRGEYQKSEGDCGLSTGSPPLARGIPKLNTGRHHLTGITPACAGNTT